MAPRGAESIIPTTSASVNKAVASSGFSELAQRTGNDAGRGIDSVINMVGHHQIGSGLGIIAAKLGVEQTTFFKATPQRYWLDVPAHGISLELSRLEDDEHGVKTPTQGVHANHDRWALHSVKLYSNQQSVATQETHGIWAHAWPAGINAERITFEMAEQLLGQDHSIPPTKKDPRVSFFRAGLHGTASVIELSFTTTLKSITQLYATHLGTTVAWPLATETETE